ncbi:hypothetical protein JCM14469_01640 [Desulfatiferula olefinivorans]
MLSQRHKDTPMRKAGQAFACHTVPLIDIRRMTVEHAIAPALPCWRLAGLLRLWYLIRDQFNDSPPPMRGLNHDHESLYPG